MGPGGTERTGRPSRHAGSSSSHDSENVEQLELVYNHTLVKPDLRKSELRQFHRPRLPLMAVQRNRAWQFQLRIFSSKHNPKDKKKGTSSSSEGSTVGSYHSFMDGSRTNTNGGNVVRNEADLSPSEGNLILLEYCEERPQIQLSKGMGCKIVNYYRGNKANCPISAGGGDRPLRKRGKKNDTSPAQDDLNEPTPLLLRPGEKPPSLSGPKRLTSVRDLIGLIKKKTKTLEEKETEHNPQSKTILPEGITEMLHPKVHGPFIGEVEDNTIQTGLFCNLFVAPMFRHEPIPSDFLMILGKMGSSRQSYNVILRPLPQSTFTVGQTEPRLKVFAPNTTGEKNFTAPFVTYQIAKALARTEAKEGRGLRFDEINDRLFANTVLLPNALRQRIKQVAIYDKNTQIWTTKPVGFEDYPGVEALGRRFSPEGVAAYESACAANIRLKDLGMRDLHTGSSGGVASVAAAMAYLNGAATAARERKHKMAKMAEYAKSSSGATLKGTTKSSNKNGGVMSHRQLVLFEKAAEILEKEWKDLKKKQDVARFIYEELQLSPWHLTAEFIEVHKHAQGTAMMRLTGLGDPSGRGEAFNFLREVDAKPNKGTGNSDGALNAQIKKITGTENDLRKLTMKQMASLLRSYGMGQKEIDTLKRWDRVHVIRDLSTKAASDGMGDGLERYARGEKMKLSDQKQMYRERIQEIWRRQRAALNSTEAANAIIAKAALTKGGDPKTVVKDSEEKKEVKKPTVDPMMDDSDSDSDDDDDDFVAALEEDMMDVRETNQILADSMKTGSGPAAPHQRDGDTDMSKDARELAALKRQREEERVAQEGLKTTGADADRFNRKTNMDIEKPKITKVIRRKITRSYPDGRQEITFRFFVRPEEVKKIMDQAAKKANKKGANTDSFNTNRKNKKATMSTDSHEKVTVGHSMFEEEDDREGGFGRSKKPSMKIQIQRSARVVTKKKSARSSSPFAPSSTSTMSDPKKARPSSSTGGAPKLQLAKMKQKVSKDKKLKKRQREAEEAELYSTIPQRKGTSNRRERGAARERMPHVLMSDALERIRFEVQKRPSSTPFQRPVNRRAVPRYYEVISEPIDLQTIRDKNARYEYRTVDTFLVDFLLMKNNAIKFNGVGSILGDEATSIYEYVRTQVESQRDEFTQMEAAVKEQLSGGNRKKKKQKKNSKDEKLSGSNTTSGDDNDTAGNTGLMVLDGVSTKVELGDISFGFGADDDTDSDDSAAGPSGNKVGV